MSHTGGVDDCRDAVHTLYHFLDGHLDDARRARIQRHLDECMPCVDAFGFERELRLVIASKCRDTVPESLRIRVAMALGRDPGSVLPPAPPSGFGI